MQDFVVLNTREPWPVPRYDDSTFNILVPLPGTSVEGGGAAAPLVSNTDAPHCEAAAPAVVANRAFKRALCATYYRFGSGCRVARLATSQYYGQSVSTSRLTSSAEAISITEAAASLARL